MDTVRHHLAAGERCPGFLHVFAMIKRLLLKKNVQKSIENSPKATTKPKSMMKFSRPSRPNFPFARYADQRMVFETFGRRILDSVRGLARRWMTYEPTDLTGQLYRLRPGKAITVVSLHTAGKLRERTCRLWTSESLRSWCSWWINQ